MIVSKNQTPKEPYNEEPQKMTPPWAQGMISATLALVFGAVATFAGIQYKKAPDSSTYQQVSETKIVMKDNLNRPFNFWYDPLTDDFKTEQGFNRVYGNSQRDARQFYFARLDSVKKSLEKQIIEIGNDYKIQIPRLVGAEIVDSVFAHNTEMISKQKPIKEKLNKIYRAINEIDSLYSQNNGR